GELGGGETEGFARGEEGPVRLRLRIGQRGVDVVSFLVERLVQDLGALVRAQRPPAAALPALLGPERDRGPDEGRSAIAELQAGFVLPLKGVALEKVDELEVLRRAREPLVGHELLD